MRTNRNRSRLIALLLTGAVILLAACGGDSTPTSAPTSTPPGGVSGIPADTSGDPVTLNGAGGSVSLLVPVGWQAVAASYLQNTQQSSIRMQFVVSPGALVNTTLEDYLSPESFAIADAEILFSTGVGGTVAIIKSSTAYSAQVRMLNGDLATVTLLDTTSSEQDFAPYESALLAVAQSLLVQ